MVYTVTCNPAGWNLRNELSHGFIDDVGASIAAMLIQCMLFLRYLSPTAVEEPEQGQSSD